MTGAEAGQMFEKRMQQRTDMKSRAVLGRRRPLAVAGALFAAAAAVFGGDLSVGNLTGGSLVGGSLAHARSHTHPDCRIHGVRPYSHRHVGPDGRAVTCDRPALTGRFATAARCVAEGIENGRPVLGTRVASEIPLSPDDNARIRAQALNEACAEAIAGCQQAAAGLGRRISCERMDVHFAQ